MAMTAQDKPELFRMMAVWHDAIRRLEAFSSFYGALSVIKSNFTAGINAVTMEYRDEARRNFYRFCHKANKFRFMRMPSFRAVMLFPFGFVGKAPLLSQHHAPGSKPTGFYYIA